MKTIFYSIMVAAGFFVAWPAGAVTYICQSDDRAVFSSDKINSSCRPSQMNGISSQPAVQAPAQAQTQTTDKIEQIWENEQFGPYDDVKIAPSSKSGAVTNSADAAPPPLEIKLRNRQKKNAARKPNILVPQITTAPAKQQLSRKQILQNEVRNEQTALVRTKAQLSVARKKGDQAKISRLERDIRDREANIRAIQSEMKR